MFDFVNKYTFDLQNSWGRNFFDYRPGLLFHVMLNRTKEEQKMVWLII